MTKLSGALGSWLAMSARERVDGHADPSVPTPRRGPGVAPTTSLTLTGRPSSVEGHHRAGLATHGSAPGVL